MRLLTAASKDYRELADITERSKLAYGRRWGHEVICEEHTEANRHRMQWERPELWRKYLKGSGYLWFTGADVGITNLDIDVLRNLSRNPADLIICCDGNGLQCDSWILRECQESDRFLRRVLDWEGLVGAEQVAMCLVLAGCLSHGTGQEMWADLQREWMPYHPNWAGGGLLERVVKALDKSPLRVMWARQKDLNAYPAECYPDCWSTCQESWQPGDPVAHIPARPMQTRIDWFKRHIAA